MYVYMAASKSRTLYIGVTNNLERRMVEHKARECPGFTATYNCDRLVWFEHYALGVKAISREKQLKGWVRAKKVALIEETNPTWEDLSAEWTK